MCDPNQSSDSLGYVYTLDPEEHLIRDAGLEKRLIHIWRSLDSPLKVSMRLAQKLWPGSTHDQCTFRSATVQGTLQSKVWAASHSIPSWTFFRFSRKSYMANTLSALEPIRMVQFGDGGNRQTRIEVHWTGWKTWKETLGLYIHVVMYRYIYIYIIYHARSVYSLYCIISAFVASWAYAPATHFTSFPFPMYYSLWVTLYELHQQRPEHCPEEVNTIMRLCWAGEPRDRPMFKQLLKQLTKLAIAQSA